MSDARVEARHVRRVRAGHGANCSSVGSVIDTLFATAVVGGALLAAIAAALAREPVQVVGQRDDAKRRGNGNADADSEVEAEVNAGAAPPEDAT